MLSDIEIARSQSIRPIKEIAAKLGIGEDTLEPYGKYKAKLPLSLVNEESVKKSRLILVSAINPTPAGEGKTTVSIGLVDGLNKIGKKAVAALREPSLGPVFGLKGGATGGGYTQVVPMEDINLHFNGDFAAIEKANNLLAAMIDNSLQSKKNNLNLDARTIAVKRVMDMNDRALRQIIIGLGGSTNGIPRQDGFNITAASEVMAILCLATSFKDLKVRLGNIYVGSSLTGQPIFAKDLQAENAMAILLKDAIKPNLVQTLEGNPAILHGGPFANIAQGTNSILATKMAMSLGEYVVTEAGFGADLGAEKFLHLKCQTAGIMPQAVVIVASVRALRHHGGATAKELSHINLTRVEQGFENLAKHIENIRKFGYTAIVAINHFHGDGIEEITFVKEACQKLGVKAVISDGFTQGGAGVTELAQAVVDQIDSEQETLKPLYPTEASIMEKMAIIAREIYGANGVDYSKEAESSLKLLKKLGFDQLPICVAKTQKSLSDDESKIGRPTNFRVTVREFEIAAGAGFIVPILGKIMRMPGLPDFPAAIQMSIDDNFIISGLS